MSSPAIPHSKSAPDITSPHPKSATGNTSPHSKSAPDITSPHSPPNIPHSSKSIISSRSAGSPLTTSSPYYKGLTDSSLVISREKLSGTSPGRESRATSYASSGSKSSFAVKVQEWGSSCFTSKSSVRSHYSSSGSSWMKSSRDNRFTTSSSSSSSRVTETVALTKIRTRAMKTDTESAKKLTVRFRKSGDNLALPTMEKPLREIDSELPPMLPLPLPLIAASPPESLPYQLPEIKQPTTRLLISPPPTPPHSDEPPTPSPPQVIYPSRTPAVQAPSPQPPAAGVVPYENKERITTKNGRLYVWADRYRPVWLQDFLCNREKALWLKNIVKNSHDKSEECGHFIFEGIPGAGKKTMIWALLREAFGPDKVQVQPEIPSVSQISNQPNNARRAVAMV